MIRGDAFPTRKRVSTTAGVRIALVGASVALIAVSTVSPDVAGATSLGAHTGRLAATPAKPAVAAAPSTGGWQIKSPPEPTAPEGQLDSVSCPSAGSCVAVGVHENSQGVDEPLAEGSNGATWTNQTTVQSPSGSTLSELSAVSCLSADDCIAVGYSEDASGTDQTLAEAWNGTAWNLQTPANPPGSLDSELSGVTCPSSTKCRAVGYYQDPSGTEETLAEVWDGSTWSIQTTPDPSGSSASGLSGVSCSSGGDCVAVGYYDDSSGIQQALAEGWDGSTWSIQTTPVSSTGSALSGVSCGAAFGCTAVGYQYVSGAELPLAEVRAGSSWTVADTADPASGDWSGLAGVSCFSATVCSAVGYYYSPVTSTDMTFAEVWDGTTWTTQTPANPTNDVYSDLAGVSCTSASGCTAVGYGHQSSAGDDPRSPRTGTAPPGPPSRPPTRRPAPTAFSSAISCVSPSDCTAVGSSASAPLAAVWNGTTWKLYHPPSPSGSISAVLDAVSCLPETSGAYCLAVGSYTQGVAPAVFPLAELWDGTKWTPKESGIDPGTRDGSLSGVSCVSPSYCMAVGYLGVFPIGEVWNAPVWTVEPRPPVPGSSVSAQLSAVWCSAVNICLAVGYNYTSVLYFPMAEMWNGTTWTRYRPPSPSGSAWGHLDGLTCTSKSACTAVGFYLTSSGAQLPLADSWNGTTWAMQAAADPGGGEIESQLSGVSCTAAAACTAVGYYQDASGTDMTLVEALTGTTWTVEGSPNPAGSNASFLTGVSCSGSVCFASGDYSEQGVEQLLAEDTST